MARRNRTTDPHAAYSDQGIKLAFGRHWRDGIIDVATAKDGAACDCCCPACDRPLVARQGSRRRHFMHAKPKGGGDLNFECDGGQMTALHLFAQRLLVEKKTLTLPAVAGGVGDQRIEWRNAGEWTFEHSAMEEAVGSVRPDVVLTTGENRLHVEIFVTHACPPEKVEAVRVGGFAMVEIDLSKTDRDVDLPGLENWILHGAPRRWIHNRHVVEIEAVIVARREERLRAEAKREERLLAKAAADLKAAYRRAERVVLADDPEADPQVRRADEGGWKPFITGFPALAPGLFTVHADRWRSAILTSFLRNHQGQTVDGLAAALSREGMVNRRLSGRSLDEYNEGVRAGLPTRDAVVALEDYLRFLELSGAARDTGGYWTRDPSIRLLLDAQDEREAKREASLVERRRRIDRLVRLLDEIGFGLPSAAAFADLNEAWRDGPLWSSTPLEIAQADGDRWGDLERALAAILKCMHDGTPDPAPQTLGLPFVAEAMELGIGRRHQRAADEQDRIRRREEEKVAELARQAEWRAADIRKEAVTSLGYEAEKWLSTYLLERRATPEELARRSDRSLGHARDALRDAVALRKDMNRPGTRRGW